MKIQEQGLNGVFSRTYAHNIHVIVKTSICWWSPYEHAIPKYSAKVKTDLWGFISLFISLPGEKYWLFMINRYTLSRRPMRYDRMHCFWLQMTRYLFKAFHNSFFCGSLDPRKAQSCNPECFFCPAPLVVSSGRLTCPSHSCSTCSYFSRRQCDKTRVSFHT